MEPAEALAVVRGYLDKEVTATLVDDRVITGTFTCLDRQGNVLIRDALEAANQRRKYGLQLGMVLIHLRHMKSCRAVERTERDRQSS